MPHPINLTVFATKDDVNNGDTFRQGIINFVSRYQRTKSDISIKFISPVEELFHRTYKFYTDIALCSLVARYEIYNSLPKSISIINIIFCRKYS